MFVGTRWSRFLDAHPEQVRRGVHALIASGVAVEETVPHIRGTGRVCRIFSRRLYRALDAEDIRHRRIASPTVLMRRVVLLEYLLGHPDLPWLPTEPQKIDALKALAERHRSVEVVTAVRTDKEFGRAQAILQCRVRAAGPSEASSDVRAELARIERAVLRGTPGVLEEFAGLRTALKRSIALAARPGIDPPRQHLEIGAPLRSPFPMSGPGVTPLLECEKDTGDRFTFSDACDSQGHDRATACAERSYRSATRQAVAGRATRPETSAPPLWTPQ